MKNRMKILSSGTQIKNAIRHCLALIITSVCGIGLFVPSSKASQAIPKSKAQLMLKQHSANNTTSPSSEIEPGSGGEYVMTRGPDRTKVEVYFLEAPAKGTFTIEVAMKSLTDNPQAQISMIQQFYFKMIGDTFQIIKGYLKIPQIAKPQIIPESALSGLGGLQMKSFLIHSQKEVDGKKIGSETIALNGRSYKTDHYQKNENGITLDYWISEDAKPMGMVKISSKGPAIDDNYQLSYQGPLTSKTAVINPSDAVPMDGLSDLLIDFMSPKK